MGRVSQAQARENRERVVSIAAKLFRERGVDGVSVADVMGAAGLTHGGFYKQFASKEALVAEAFVAATAEQAGRIEGLDRDRFIDVYLSPRHRDDPGAGCPVAALGSDMTHAAPDNPAKVPYAEGLESYARLLGTAGGEDLAAVSTLVGAIILSRATAGTALSDRILDAAREALLGGLSR